MDALRHTTWAIALAVLALTGCSFTESDEISQPPATRLPNSGPAATSTTASSGAKTLVALDPDEFPAPSSGSTANGAKELIALLSSDETAADLPQSDGRYELSDRVIVAQPETVHGLRKLGMLPTAVTAEVPLMTEAEPTDVGRTDGPVMEQASLGTDGGSDPADPQPPTRRSKRTGTMVIPAEGPVRLIVTGTPSCCGFALARRDGAYSIEITTTADDGPNTVHLMVVGGTEPVAELPEGEEFIPPAATAVPLTDLEHPSMTFPPDLVEGGGPSVTDPPPNPEKRATVQLPPPVPPGTWCGYLAARSVPFSEVVQIWNQLGRPGHMDADNNGIPCETRY